MSNFVWCHGPRCHTSHTQDRIRGVKGSKVLRTRKVKQDQWNSGERYNMYSNFCSQGCKNEWLNTHMESIEQSRPIEFIRHRRESGGYQKVTTTHDSWNGGTYNSNSIQRINGTDN